MIWSKSCKKLDDAPRRNSVVDAVQLVSSGSLEEEEADAGTLLLPLYADSAAKLIRERRGEGSEGADGRTDGRTDADDSLEETEGEGEEGEGERCKSDSLKSVGPCVLPNGRPRFRSPLKCHIIVRFVVRPDGDAAAAAVRRASLAPVRPSDDVALARAE